MLSLYRHIKAALAYATRFPWVPEPLWDAHDAKNLATFLATPTGARLKAAYVNAVLRQQASALQADHGKLVFEAGFSAGQKGFVAFTEGLADAQRFSEQGEQDTDPATIQPES